MNPRNVHPIDYFNAWFAQPIVVDDNSVTGTIDALNRHPLAEDQTATDYVMPARRCRERAGRFRIYGENQDVFYCFVFEGDESKTDPPVYFESSLDLKVDYGIDDADMINNDYVLVAQRFTDFLWHILGRHICLRMESGNQFAAGVNGIVFDGGVELDESFINPVVQQFPAGFTCFVSDDAVCIPDWGAAFLGELSRDTFIHRYSPSVSRRWK